MAAETWFLVVANYRHGTHQLRRFTDNREALDAYALAEADYRHDRGMEVVLIAADDETSLRRNYPHLFGARHMPKKDALRMLGESAFA